MSLQSEEILDKYCDEMNQAGICEKSTGAYNSPILLLRKNSDNPAHQTDWRTFRVAADHRFLNQHIADPRTSNYQALVR
jgi:hypothetical protein